MGAKEDLAVVQSGYEAFGRGDIPAVLEVFSPDIQWLIPGRSPMAGTYKGHEEVVGFFGQLMERSGGTFGLEVEDFLATDQHVVVLVRETGERDGKRLDNGGAHVWRIKDGKAVEFSAMAADQYAQDDFWSDHRAERVTRLIVLVEWYRQRLDDSNDNFGMWPSRAFFFLNATIGGLASFLAALPVAAIRVDGLEFIGRSAVWGGLIGAFLTFVLVSVNGIARLRRRRASQRVG